MVRGIESNTKPSQKEENIMTHNLKIKVAKENTPEVGIVACKKKKVRRGLLKKLFGAERDKVTIIIPGDTVRNVTICEVDDEKEKGGKAHVRETQCN